MSVHVRTSQGPQIHLGPQGVNEKKKKRNTILITTENTFNLSPKKGS